MVHQPDLFMNYDDNKYSRLSDKKPLTSVSKSLPSLRRDKQTIDSEYGLHATPEFKSFVAKKLSEEIDR